MSEQFKNLIGKEVLSVEFSENTLRFNLKHDAVIYEAVGDCCSSSFIEDLDNIEALQNAVLESVDVVEGEVAEKEDWKVSEWTFYKFKTNKGLCTLSFRNDSNGYYNGRLELRK